MPRKKKQTSEDYNAVFPTRLRKVMDEKNITQQKLADATRKTRQTISYYADGSSNPHWSTLAKIAEVCGVSTDWLLGRSESMTTDMTLAEISEYTKLHPDAIAALHKAASDDENNIVAWFIDLFSYGDGLEDFRKDARLSVLSELSFSKMLDEIPDNEQDGGSFNSDEEHKDFCNRITSIETDIEDRLLEEICGKRKPGSKIEISADLAKSLYRQRAERYILSAFNDALEEMEQEIIRKYMPAE